MVQIVNGRQASRAGFNTRGEPVEHSGPVGEIRLLPAFSLEGKNTVQVRSLVRFDSRYGPVRAGDVFTAEEGYAQGLIRDRKVERVPEDLRPERTQVIQEAPKKKALESSQPSSSESRNPSAPESTPVDGQAKPSALSRVGRAARKLTRTTREPAAK
jgi:hypothetical protein